MHTKSFALAATLLLSISGAAVASTAGPVNVSNAIGLSDGVPTTYAAMKRSGRKAMKRSSKRSTMMRSRRDVAPTATPGSPSGTSTGNATTGSGAAPSGR